MVFTPLRNAEQVREKHITELQDAIQDYKAPQRLAQVILGAAAANIDFNGISGSYTNLVLELLLRGDTVASSVSVALIFNNDGGANYDDQYVVAAAAVMTAAEVFATTAIPIGSMAAANAAVGLFTQYTFKVNGYSSAVAQKVAQTTVSRKLGVASGDLSTITRASFWRSTAAITRITLTPAAGNFGIGTQATLYGMP